MRIIPVTDYRSAAQSYQALISACRYLSGLKPGPTQRRRMIRGFETVPEARTH
jgi:hypothetical protein